MMRITTGLYRGRKLSGPFKIRPTQDKVRKAFFDILGGVEGLSFLELYAGSGAVGLEASSRGAGEVVMVEQGAEPLLFIKKNIEALKPQNVQLVRKEALSAIQAMHKAGKTFDIVFFDPPYHKGLQFSSRSAPDAAGGVSLAKKTLQTLGAYDILAPNGFAVVQHFKKDELREKEGFLRLFKQSFYGDTVLSFYRKG